MSLNKSNVTKNKKIKTSFTAKQPGYINVAGESFFLSDEDDASAFSTKLYDDSIKGELAFQDLFLKPFTTVEQQTLRRIYRTIFGSGSIIGKKGLSLPCEDDEVELLVKSLIYRRDKLIQQIKSYGILLSNDMHARYMREHLLKLNKLIDDDIPNTLAPCKDTIIDDRFGRLSLNNTRMMKLLEIFAFLLAQGKDPVESLIQADPSAMDILPRMAKPQAKKLRDYEAAYTKENPGKVPEYTDTLKKIKRILTDTTPEPATDSELLQVIADIEKDLGIQDSSGSASDRKGRILNEIKILKQAVIEEGNCKRALAAITEERDKLTQKVKDFESKAGSVENIDGLKKKITELQDEITALRGQYDEDTKTTADVQAKLSELKKQKADLERQLALRPTVEALNELQRQLDSSADITPEDLARLQMEYEALSRRADITPEALAALRAELNRLRAGEPVDITALQAEIDRLRQRADITPEALAALQAQVTNLQQRPTPEQLAEIQRQLDEANRRVTELSGRAEITPEELASLRTSLEAAQRQVAELSGRAAITPDELTTLRTSLESAQRQLGERGEITPDELDRMRSSLQAALRQVAELSGRAAITPDELTTLRASLETAQRQLGQRGEIAPDELDRMRSSLQAALRQVAELSGRAAITPDELTTLRTSLEAAERQLGERAKITPDELTRLRTSLEAAQRQLGERGEITPDELARMRSSLEAALRQVAELSGRAAITPDELATLRTNFSALQQEVTTLRTRVAMTPEEFEVYRLAKQKLDELNRALAGITPERIKELLQAEEERNTLRTRLKSYEDIGVTPEQIRSLQEQVQQKEAELVELRKRANITPEEYEEQKLGLLRAAQTIKNLSIYKQLFNDLNSLLRKKGMNPLPEPTDENMNLVIGQLDASINPQGISELSTLCLLNMLYGLFKNIYTNHGNPWYGSTDTQKYKVTFEKFNKLRTLNLDADIGELFFWAIQALNTKGAPDATKAISVVSADKVAKYNTIYAKIKEILNGQPFQEQDRDVASYILRDLLPAYKNFNRYILQEGNTITLLQPSQQTNFKRMDISVLFLLFLTYVNKFLTEKRTELEAAGCPTL